MDVEGLGSTAYPKCPCRYMIYIYMGSQIVVWTNHSQNPKQAYTLNPENGPCGSRVCVVVMTWDSKPIRFRVHCLRLNGKGLGFRVSGLGLRGGKTLCTYNGLIALVTITRTGLMYVATILCRHISPVSSCCQVS